MSCEVEDDGPSLELALMLPASIGGQWKVIAADCMVIPLALSAGKKSVTVDPSSTSVLNGKLLNYFKIGTILAVFTSNPIGITTIIEHTLCGCCLPLTRISAFNIKSMYHIATNRIDMGYDTNISGPVQSRIFCTSV
jgi:hypothetical protein